MKHARSRPGRGAFVADALVGTTSPTHGGKRPGKMETWIAVASKRRSPKFQFAPRKNSRDLQGTKLFDQNGSKCTFRATLNQTKLTLSETEVFAGAGTLGGVGRTSPPE